MAQPLPPLPVLVGIGLAGGFFSALFGVGGGIVVVPLLILLAGFDGKPATGTSLVVIGFAAVFGVIAFSVGGRVEWHEAALVGLPAMLGTVAGTWLQQRISSRLLVVLFAVLLVAVAVELLLQ